MSLDPPAPKTEIFKKFVSDSSKSEEPIKGELKTLVESYLSSNLNEGEKSTARHRLIGFLAYGASRQVHDNEGTKLETAIREMYALLGDGSDEIINDIKKDVKTQATALQRWQKGGAPRDVPPRRAWKQIVARQALGKAMFADSGAHLHDYLTGLDPAELRKDFGNSIAKFAFTNTTREQRVNLRNLILQDPEQAKRLQDVLTQLDLADTVEDYDEDSFAGVVEHISDNLYSREKSETDMEAEHKKEVHEAEIEVRIKALNAPFGPLSREHREPLAKLVSLQSASPKDKNELKDLCVEGYLQETSVESVKKDLVQNPGVLTILLSTDEGSEWVEDNGLGTEEEVAAAIAELSAEERTSVLADVKGLWEGPEPGKSDTVASLVEDLYVAYDLNALDEIRQKDTRILQEINSLQGLKSCMESKTLAGAKRLFLAAQGLSDAAALWGIPLKDLVENSWAEHYLSSVDVNESSVRGLLDLNPRMLAAILRQGDDDENNLNAMIGAAPSADVLSLVKGLPWKDRDSIPDEAMEVIRTCTDRLLAEGALSSNALAKDLLLFLAVVNVDKTFLSRPEIGGTITAARTFIRDVHGDQKAALLVGLGKAIEGGEFDGVGKAGLENLFEACLADVARDIAVSTLPFTVVPLAKQGNLDRCMTDLKRIDPARAALGFKRLSALDFTHPMLDECKDICAQILMRGAFPNVTDRADADLAVNKLLLGTDKAGTLLGSERSALYFLQGLREGDLKNWNGRQELAAACFEALPRDERLEWLLHDPSMLEDLLSDPHAFKEDKVLEGVRTGSASTVQQLIINVFESPRVQLLGAQESTSILKECMMQLLEKDPKLLLDGELFKTITSSSDGRALLVEVLPKSQSSPAIVKLLNALLLQSPEDLSAADLSKQAGAIALYLNDRDALSPNSIDFLEEELGHLTELACDAYLKEGDFGSTPAAFLSEPQSRNDSALKTLLSNLAPFRGRSSRAEGFCRLLGAQIFALDKGLSLVKEEKPLAAYKIQYKSMAEIQAGLEYLDLLEEVLESLPELKWQLDLPQLESDLALRYLQLAQADQGDGEFSERGQSMLQLVLFRHAGLNVKSCNDELEVRRAILSLPAGRIEESFRIAVKYGGTKVMGLNLKSIKLDKGIQLEFAKVGLQVIDPSNREEVLEGLSKLPVARMARALAVVRAEAGDGVKDLDNAEVWGARIKRELKTPKMGYELLLDDIRRVQPAADRMKILLLLDQALLSIGGTDEPLNTDIFKLNERPLRVELRGEKRGLVRRKKENSIAGIGEMVDGVAGSLAAMREQFEDYLFDVKLPSTELKATNFNAPEFREFTDEYVTDRSVTAELSEGFEEINLGVDVKIAAKGSLAAKGEFCGDSARVVRFGDMVLSIALDSAGNGIGSREGVEGLEDFLLGYFEEKLRVLPEPVSPQDVSNLMADSIVEGQRQFLIAMDMVSNAGKFQSANSLHPVTASVSLIVSDEEGKKYACGWVAGDARAFLVDKDGKCQDLAPTAYCASAGGADGAIGDGAREKYSPPYSGIRGYFVELQPGARLVQGSDGLGDNVEASTRHQTPTMVFDQLEESGGLPTGVDRSNLPPTWDRQEDDVGDALQALHTAYAEYMVVSATESGSLFRLCHDESIAKLAAAVDTLGLHSDGSRVAHGMNIGEATGRERILEVALKVAEHFNKTNELEDLPAYKNFKERCESPDNFKEGDYRKIEASLREVSKIIKWVKDLGLPKVDDIVISVITNTAKGDD